MLLLFLLLLQCFVYHLHTGVRAGGGIGEYHLTPGMLDIFSCFCCLLTFVKIKFFKSSFRNTIRVSNYLDPDQE